MKKVSVIIPVYGVEKYIERCAESLFSQTLDSIEFIFIDDCTQDNSMKILETVVDKNRLRFARMNWDVRIERMPTNSGLPAVRRHGINLATGDYLIHCDSDDWVDENMYKALYEKAVSENADVVVCDYATVGGQDDREFKGCLHTDATQFIQDCCSQVTSWSACNKLVKTSFVRTDFTFPTGNMGEDMVITLQVLLKAKIIAYVPQTLYYYFTNPESITKIVSTDSILSKYNQFRGNVDIVIPLLEDSRHSGRYEDCVYKLKWRTRQHIWGLVHDKEFYLRWKETYPELDRQLLLRKGLSIKDKILYVFTRLRIYPFSFN